MNPQDAIDFVGQQWVLHGDEANAWIATHRWTLLLIAALLLYLWVRDQKRREKL